ncbi:MAG: ferrous iron transport protein A [Candidatus Omnitrophica bacterium]|nr:ferrous iron transport protein A [Candidatus Omnitrophota bacterium]
MPLTLLGIGEKATITQLTGDTNLRLRLTELGFSLGKGIEIIQRAFGNHLIVRLENVRIALDRRMALHIQIHMLQEEAHVQ